MENKSTTSNSKKTRNWYWGGLLLIGIVISASKIFIYSDVDSTIVTLIALGSAFLYYWLKSKLRTENNKVKIFIAFILSYSISAIAVGVLTSFL